MTLNEGVAVLFDPDTQGSASGAAGLAALLLDVLLELGNGSGLFCDELFDRSTPRCWRQCRVDQEYLALDMGDDPLLCGG